MQAGQDPAVAAGVEQRQGEALVAAGLLERVVADEPDPLERAPLRAPRGRPSGRPARRARATPRTPCRGARRGRPRGCGPSDAAGQAGAAGHRAGASAGRGRATARRSDERPTIERPTTMGAEVRLDERVEVDPRVLRWGRSSLAGRPYPDRSASETAVTGGRECYPLPSAARVDRRSGSAPADRSDPRWRPSPDHGQASPRQRRPDRDSAHPSSAAADPPALPADRRHRPRSWPRPPDTLTDEEEARAAELEAAIVAEERRPRPPSSAHGPRAPTDPVATPRSSSASRSRPPRSTPTSLATSGGSRSWAVARPLPARAVGRLPGPWAGSDLGSLRGPRGQAGQQPVGAGHAGNPRPHRPLRGDVASPDAGRLTPGS